MGSLAPSVPDPVICHNRGGVGGIAAVDLVKVRIEQKIEGWKRRGLIDGATASRLLQFESQKSKPLLLYSVLTIAALAIVVGVIAIVAANWTDIPDAVKLAADVLLAIGLAFGIYSTDERKKNSIRDTLIAIFYGFVLASIALIGQIFHLKSELWKPLVTWTAIASPAVFLGSAWTLGLVWLFGTTAAIVAIFDQYSRWIEEWNLQGFAVFLVIALPLLLSSIPWIRKTKPHFASAFRGASWAFFLLASSAFQSGWYIPPFEQIHAQFLSLTLTALGLLSFAFFENYVLVQSRNNRMNKNRRGLAVFVVFALLSSYAPFLFDHETHHWLGGLSFILLWAAAGWAAFEAGLAEILPIITAIIALRIVVIYFEVFGTLLDTGLGLITGGLFTLFMTWLWLRYAKKLKRIRT